MCVFCYTYSLCSLLRIERARSSIQIFHAKINPPGLHLSLYVSLVSSAFIHALFTLTHTHSLSLSFAVACAHAFIDCILTIISLFFLFFFIDLEHRLALSLFLKIRAHTTYDEHQAMIYRFFLVVRSLWWTAFFFNLSINFVDFIHFYSYI